MKLLRFIVVAIALSGCARKEFNNPYDPKNVLYPPELHSPADGAITPDNPPQFIWSAVADMEIYQVEIDDDPDFGSPEVRQYWYYWGDTCFVPSRCFNSSKPLLESKGRR